MTIQKILIFLIFLTIGWAVYYIVPKKYRYFVMLGYSIGVIYILSGWLLVLILFEGFVVFFCGIILEYLKSKQSYAKNILSKDEYSLYKIKIGKQKNLVSFLGVSLVLLLLFLCKYLNAFIKLENNIVTWFGGSGNIGFATLLAPLGLSYFSLVSISYIVDVKRGKYHAERNIFKVITFICFFPTLFEGPIGRYDRLKSSLLEGDTNPSEENYIDGLLRIMFGLLKKVVIADRLAVFTTAVITNYTDHSGLFIFWGMIAYTIRLYCDFSGIIDIVIGTSKCFGIKLDENFRQPFFSHSISEFWRRWHITLSDWFKEYVFYPVSMSKPILAINKGLLKIKFNHYWASFIPTALSVIFIWALTGVWHGSSLVYLVYGVYYGLIMVFEMMLDHINLYGKVKINPIYKVFSSIVVFVLVNIGLSLFCSSQLSDFNEKMRLLFIADEDSIITIFSLREVLISLFGFFIVCLVDIIQYSGKQIKFLNSKVFKYGAIVCLFIGVVVFGAYGMGYDYIEPIYDEF